VARGLSGLWWGGAEYYHHFCQYLYGLFVKGKSLAKHNGTKASEIGGTKVKSSTKTEMTEKCIRKMHETDVSPLEITAPWLLSEKQKNAAVQSTTCRKCQGYSLQCQGHYSKQLSCKARKTVLLIILAHKQSKAQHSRPSVSKRSRTC
jgi:hypothetical protein